ncbi:MAG: hypothetical protein IT228_04570 [Flavobacteriales bacterium]|nr:hypothetical protein [Flavobacteriales bacterium]MCC6576598.1 hypothetical protein [Flavobacteriales bacterium]NUQ14919.1 hypothetical protein [Flavobacteriales bacterium]
MDGFRRMADGGAVEPIAHLAALLAGAPDALLRIGSDSQNLDDRTIYTTTVVLRYRGNGAHVIYLREGARRIPDLWPRLWGEVERSLAVARWLNHEGHLPVHGIDLDLNPDPGAGSHPLYSAAVGLVRAHGYEPRTKPDLLMATWAANVLCHRGG